MDVGTALYANIIIDISHEKVDRLFQYRIPDRLLGKVDVGDCVVVPFGKGDTQRKGYVIELAEEPNWDPDKIKEIIAVNLLNNPPLLKSTPRDD